MNILLATDNNYVQHCAVTMCSVLKNNNKATFYLLTEFISEENQKKLHQMVNEFGGELLIITVDSEAVKDFPMSAKASSHISIATYYRLFVISLLPSNIDKIIYLDCDIVVRGDISKLWNEDIGNYALAAVYQYNEWAIKNNSFGRLNYPEKYGYFNAGVLLLNLDYWRRNNVTNRLLSFISDNFLKIISHDQDTLNAVLHSEAKPLSCNWNFLPFFFRKDLNEKITFPEGYSYKEEVNEILLNPTIMHFVSLPKPWEYASNHPFRSEYFKYLVMTPWCNYQVRFNLKNYIFYILFPFLNRILKGQKIKK